MLKSTLKYTNEIICFWKNELGLSYEFDCILPPQNHVSSHRLVLKQKKYCHITPHLVHLHWLPVKFRIQYKILVMVFKCLHGEGPSYLASLLERHNPTRSLRSSDKNMLVKPRTKRRWGDRAFSAAGPSLWNVLPDKLKNCELSLDCFKKELKTHLFKKAYGLQ